MEHSDEWRERAIWWSEPSITHDQLDSEELLGYRSSTMCLSSIEPDIWTDDIPQRREDVERDIPSQDDWSLHQTTVLKSLVSLSSISLFAQALNRPRKGKTKHKMKHTTAQVVERREPQQTQSTFYQSIHLRWLSCVRGGYGYQIVTQHHPIPSNPSNNPPSTIQPADPPSSTRPSALHTK